MTKMPAAMWSSHSQLTLDFNRRMSDSITEMKKMTSLQVFKTTALYRLKREEKCRYANGLGILKLGGMRYEFKTERRIELSQHES
jgi:hypothetical protein